MNCFVFRIQWLIAGLWLLIGQPEGVCQGIDALCQPEIIHYSSEAYTGQRQNWSITQQPDNRFIYVANSKGLLEFDGNHWKLYELPRRQVVRSVASAKQDGLIYTGGLGEFGFWKPNEKGVLTYHSLKHLIREREFEKEEIWNIVSDTEQVLFQSFAFMYIYRQGNVHKINLPGTVLFAFPIGEHLLVEVLGRGLYEIKGNNLSFVSGSEFLGQESVNVILPAHRPGQWLVGTNKRLYVYDGGRFREFNSVTNQFFLQNQLNKGIRLSNGQYAFGTILDGLVITDEKGNIIRHLNRKNGLQNNTVLSLYTDKEQNLWVGMDTGLDLIRLNSPLKFYHDPDGVLGNIFDAIIHRNYLYLATNHGVFYRDMQAKTGRFLLIPQTQGQAWNLEVFNNQLLCGHNNGTFQITGTTARLISSITGGWAIRQLKNQPQVLLQGTYTKLCLYRLDQTGNWQFDGVLEGFSAPVRQMEEDTTGAIWVNTTTNGIARLRINYAHKTAAVEQWLASSEFRSSTTNLVRLNRQLVVTTEKNAYGLNYTHHQFELSRIIPKGEVPLRIFPVDTIQGFLLKQNGTLLQWTKGRVYQTGLKINGWNDDVFVTTINPQTYLICLDNGFGVFPVSFRKTVAETTYPKPFVRSLTVMDHPELMQHYEGPVSAYSNTLRYNQNGVIVAFAMPYYAKNVKYSYWLEPYTKGWSRFQEIAQKEFDNLPPGNYTLHLKSDISPQISTFQFEIRPPWYWNVYSKLLYVLLLGAMIYWAYRLHLKRLHNRQEEVRREMEYKLTLQAEKSKQELIRLRNEQLERDIVRKSEELSNVTMSLLKRNESLGKIKQHLEQLKPNTDTKLAVYSSVVKQLDHNINDKNDWKVFETNFNEVHEAFFKKLLAKYPNLTPGDLRLAAYLRMNLSTKEIAQLLNITPRSVELKRYRLRSKMLLPTEENLGELMMRF